MGPIERKSANSTGSSVVAELQSRWPTERIARLWMDEFAWTLCMGAAKSLGIDYRDIEEFWSDVLSEAIEAAETLGL